MKQASPIPVSLLRLFILSALFDLLGCDARQAAEPKPRVEGTEVVSLISVIANPERYDGKSLLVRGFLHIDYDGTALYLHHTDYQYDLTENAIAVAPHREIFAASELYSDRYVIVCGVFRCREKWGTGRCIGTLEEISSISADRNADGSHVTNSAHRSWPARAGVGVCGKDGRP